MRSWHIGLSAAALLGGGGAASAQDIMIGGTYDCDGSKRIVESCQGEYCTVQVLNPYSPDGKGARIDIYRSMVVEQYARCPVTGGTAVSAASEAPRPRAPAAPVNPAYITGAGAGVRFPGQGGTPAPAGRLVTNGYHCTAFIGTPPNGHMATMPGFTLLGGGRYRHQDGSTGSVTVDGAMLLFHGGALDGQAARFDAGATGRGTVHLYNAARSRTVIDCDGQG